MQKEIPFLSFVVHFVVHGGHLKRSPCRLVYSRAVVTV